MLVWTTTPWTLPSNLALAVGPEIDYAIVHKGGVRYVIGAATIASYKKELDGFTTERTLKGKELVGRTYEPLFPFFAKHPNSFRVLAGDFVDTAEGTGVVHMAPGFGEDDQRVCEANGIELVCPVDDRGRFHDGGPRLAGPARVRREQGHHQGAQGAAPCCSST
jgi:isoleucyl-tRNA synthetase